MVRLFNEGASSGALRAVYQKLAVMDPNLAKELLRDPTLKPESVNDTESFVAMVKLSKMRSLFADESGIRFKAHVSPR